MATVEEQLQSQLRNIETSTGRSIGDWVVLIKASGLTRHGEIVAWLKSEHGLTHGTANRLAIVALNPEPTGDAARATGAAPADSADSLYVGSKQALRPIHDRVMETLRGFGEFEVAPKKGYVSLRRRTQFGLLKPAANHVDLGLILPDTLVTPRLENGKTFNAMCTHRVRVPSVDAVDDELVGWLRAAWERAG